MNSKNNFRREKGNVLKGLAAGVVGGLVASFVMNKFQAAWSAVSESMANSDGENDKGKSDEGKKSGQREEPEPTTVKAAEAISKDVFDHDLTKSEKKYAGPAVHYATGAGSAAIYGAAAELFPKITRGAGLPFGVAVWLIVDEGAVPALGLSKSPLEYPASTHVFALASHLVFGLSTEMVRRAARRALG